MPEFEPGTSGLESSLPPLIVGLEPSVVSLQPGEETVLQLVVQGGTGSYRLPLALSFDPRRVFVIDILSAPGVNFLRSDVHAADGWIDLDVIVADGNRGRSGRGRLDGAGAGWRPGAPGLHIGRCCHRGRSGDPGGRPGRCAVHQDERDGSGTRNDACFTEVRRDFPSPSW